VPPRKERSPEYRAKIAAAQRKHGHTRRNWMSATYSVWNGMIGRCTRESDTSYPWYGGRGITVDPSWRGPGGFARFLADVGERPSGMLLGRIGDTGDYVPSNVKWMTKDEQLDQRRLKRAERQAA
jgi:hypothetical protein